MGTFASGLEARGVSTADQLVGEVEGDIAEFDGTIRITHIRVHFRIAISEDLRDKVLRLLESFSAGCPAYQSIKNCIDVRWTASLEG